MIENGFWLVGCIWFVLGKERKERKGPSLPLVNKGRVLRWKDV